MPSAPTSLRDAATVVLLYEPPDGGGVEVLMVRRHTRSGFMGGAHVFPGGKLDPADQQATVLERIAGRTAAQAAAALGEPMTSGAGTHPLGVFVAAIRETFEEAGVLLGELGQPDDLHHAWQRLTQGAAFADLIHELDITLRLDWLVPLSRWITPEVESKRFDTRFFVARLPSAQRARIDQHETTAGHWLRPIDAIRRQREGEIMLPPPTLRTLELLSRHVDVEAILREAVARAPPLVCPVVCEDGGRPAVCLPGDPEHPHRERVIGGTTRLVLDSHGWHSCDAPA